MTWDQMNLASTVMSQTDGSTYFVPCDSTSTLQWIDTSIGNEITIVENTEIKSEEMDYKNFEAFRLRLTMDERGYLKPEKK